MCYASPGSRSAGPIARFTLVLGAVTLAVACEQVSTTPVAPAALAFGSAQASASRSSDRCVNVEADGNATLGLVTLPDGTTGFGGTWTPIALGGIEGEMASVVTEQTVSGANQQGAVHLTLKHAFRTAGGDYFMTEDRAVCAPAGPNPATCRVNDVMTIVSGTGVFTNANGSMSNHGVINFAAGTLEFSARGRICGDGL